MAESKLAIRERLQDPAVRREIEYRTRKAGFGFVRQVMRRAHGDWWFTPEALAWIERHQSEKGAAR